MPPHSKYELVNHIAFASDVECSISVNRFSFIAFA